MKRFFLLLFMAILTVCAAQAVPALSKPVRVKQPDGLFVTVKLVGDEYYHYQTTTDGYLLTRADDGSLVYATSDADGQLHPTGVVAHDGSDRTAAELELLATLVPHQRPAVSAASRQMRETETEKRLQARTQHRLGLGYTYDYHDFRGLVLLVEFNDCSFSRSDYANLINRMVNQKGFTGYRTTNFQWDAFTGSVRDYFYDNSFQQFEPQFDIVGPIQINESQYITSHNATDWTKQLAYSRVVNAALDAAESQVNFKDYDRDEDGTVDMVFLIFAGAGSHSSGNDDRLMWPHAGTVYVMSSWDAAYKMSKDKVWFGRYACSTELLGPASYKYLDGIGTICHEFSHVLGLPDFYDTDYSESGGESQHPGDWSLMSGGSYMNNGRTPVGYSLYERYNAGFTTPQPISEPGHYTLDCIDNSNTGFILASGQNKEYFLLENRQKNVSKWDAYLPGHGMLVYRVDETNLRVWQENIINANPKHNYYQLLRAGNGRELQQASDPFPGTAKKTELSNMTQPSLLSWTKREAPLVIENIAESQGVITFDLVEPIYDRSNWEDFEDIAVTRPSTTDTTSLQGRMGLWTLTDGAYVASAQGKAAEKQALALVKNSNAYVTTSRPIYSLTFTLYNPTSARAMPYFYASEDGVTWTRLMVTNSEAGSGIAAGDNGLMTIQPGHKRPSYLRLFMRIGSDTEPVYLDNFQFTFDPDYVPDDPAGIEGIQQSPATHALRYFNLHGQPVSPNAHGLMIVSDGSRTWKEMR